MRRDLRDGNTYRAYIEPFPELEKMAVNAAVALKTYGPANFQLRVGTDGTAIFEINSHFSGTTVMRALTEFNEVEAAVRWAVFYEQLPLSVTKPGVVLRYWEELFLSGGQFKRVGGSKPQTTL